VRRERLADFGR
jgi:hypothetical protein